MYRLHPLSTKTTSALQKFLKAYENVANAYHQHGDRLRKEDRLDPAIFRAYLNVD